MQASTLGGFAALGSGASGLDGAMLRRASPSLADGGGGGLMQSGIGKPTTVLHFRWMPPGRSTSVSLTTASTTCRNAAPPRVSSGGGKYLSSEVPLYLIGSLFCMIRRSPCNACDT